LNQGGGAPKFLHQRFPVAWLDIKGNDSHREGEVKILAKVFKKDAKCFKTYGEKFLKGQNYLT
jgi:hypothetical protein